jgi:tape measure domain-containing protein
MDIATLGIRVDATEARLAAVELDRLGAAGGRTATSMSAVERATKLLAGAFAGISAVALARDLLKTVEQVQNLSIQLKGLTKDADDYAKVQAYLVDISNKHHKSNLILADSFSRLLTLEQSGLITRKQSTALLEGMSNASSKTGATTEQLKQSMFGLSQAMGSGVVHMEELNQVTEPMPGLLNKIAEASGYTVGEFRKLIAEGRVTSEVFGKVMVGAFASYQGAAEAAGETLTAKYADIGNAWTELAKAIESPVVNTISPILELITEQINGLAQDLKELNDFYNQIKSAAGYNTGGAPDNGMSVNLTGRAKPPVQADQSKTDAAAIRAEIEATAASTKGKKAHKEAMSEEQKAIIALANAYENQISTLLRSIALEGKSSATAAAEYDVQNGALKGLTEAKKLYFLQQTAILQNKQLETKAHESEKSELDSLIDKYNQLTLSARDYKLTQLNAQGITGTEQAPIMAQFDKNAGAEVAKKATDDATASLDAYNKKLDDANTKTSDLGAVTSAIFDGALGGINLVAGAFDSMVNSIAANTKALAENAKAQELNKSITDPKEKAANFKKYAAEEQKLNAKTVSDQITGASQMAGAAAKMFNQKSAAAKGFHAIEIGLSVLRLAMDAKEMASSIMKTGTNIMEGASKMFGQSGWFAFAGVAAMLALMAGLGFGSKGGGGGAALPPPSDTGTGTVLGDPTAVSESIGKTNDLLKTIHASEYVELRGINRGVNTLKGAISTTLDHLFQTGGMANFQPIAPKAPSVLDQLNPISGGGIGAVINTMRALATGGLSIISDFIISKIPILGSIMSSISRFFFGGKVTQSVVGQGIGTNATSLQSVIDGGNVSGYQYADIKTHTSGGLFTKSKDRYSTQYQALSSDTQKSFNDIFSSVGDTIVSIAGTLGKSIETDLMPRVMSAVIPAMRVNLMGLSGEDASKKLNGVISAMMDTMTTQIFGDIVGKYQKLGEGMLETTVRIVSEIVIVKDALNQSGLKLLAADVIAVSDAIVQAAGGLEAFQQQFEAFFDKFYSDAEKQTRLQKTLVGSLAEANLILPTTRENYKKLVEGLNMANPLDQQRYSLLLELSSAADTYYSMLESGAEKVAAIAKTQRSLDIQYMELTGNAVGALTEKRKDELAAMDDSLRLTQRSIYILTDANKAVADATTVANKAVTDAMALASKAVSAAVNEVSKAISNLSSLAQKLRAAATGNTISTDATTRKDRADAQAVLNAALKVANAGGAIDNFAGMDKALADISKPSEQLYATFIDYARDQALTSGTITQLADYADAQVSMAQQQIDAINNTTSAVNSVVGSLANLTEAQKTLATVEDQKSQIEKMLGNNLAVLSVGEAVNQLAIALNAQNAATKAIAIAQSAAKAATNADIALNAANAKALTSANALSSAQENSSNANNAAQSARAAAEALKNISSPPTTHVNGQTTNSVWESVLSQFNAWHKARYGFNMNRDWNADGDAQRAYQNLVNQYYAISNANITSATATADGLASVAAATAALIPNLANVSVADAYAASDALAKSKTASAYANATAAALPAFASGGQHEGGWRIVGENGPELEKTGASRIFSNPQSKSLLNMDELLAEIRQLRSDVRAGQQAIANNTLRTAKILRDVTQDGTAITTVVAA